MKYKDKEEKINIIPSREDTLVKDLFFLSKYVIDKLNITEVSSLEFILLSDMCYQVKAVKLDGSSVILDFEKYLDLQSEKLKRAKDEIQLLLCECDFQQIKVKLLELSLNEL